MDRAQVYEIANKIVDDVRMLLKHKILATIRYKRFYNLISNGKFEVYHVHDLIRCYNAAMIEINASLDEIEKAIESEVDFHAVPTMTELSVRKFLLNVKVPDGVYEKRVGKYVIIGKPDFEYVLGNGKVVPVEVKVGIGREVLKPENYAVMQCKFYCWLMNVNYCILLYIARKINVFIIENDLTNEKVLEYIENWKKKIPFHKDECLTCRYRHMCDLYGK